MEKSGIFVVHKHFASRLHYDFRLEIDGVLKSWAVPKGVPEDSEKRLAVLVEDHALEYAKFKGIIPEGSYGAGKVEIWDNGKFSSLLGDLSSDFKKGKLEIEMSGKKMKGKYILLKTKMGNNPKNWLLIKGKD
jgi:bifunctional non-homologous end joining protein LigD